MTNLELARRLVDANLHVQFDAVLIDANVAGGKLHGRIFLDQACRYTNDTIVTTSSIRSTEEGGRVVITGRRRYLVQMAAETEEARREAALEVDPDGLFAEHSESLDALAAEPVIDRFELLDRAPEAGPYAIGSDRVNGLSKLIEEAGEVVQVAGKVIGLGGLGVHFDGSDLEQRLEEELADLLAAVDFVIVRNRLNRGTIEARRIGKRDTFETWNSGAQVAA